MTQEEVDKLLKQDEEIRARRELERSVPRKASTNRNVSFMLDQTLYASFQDKVEQEGLSMSLVLRGAALAYTFGGLKFSGDRLVSTAEAEHNTPEGFNRSHNVSRDTDKKKSGPKPKEDKPKSKTHDDKGHLIPWHEQDHSERAIWDYKMYPEPHLASDSRPHLTFDTKGDITGEAFEYTLRHDYLREACKFSEREWQGKLWEYVSCCALKFFTLNKMQNVRYDPDTLFAEVNALYDDMQDDIASCKAYDEEQRNASK